MNILLTSAGRRVSLVRAFQEDAAIVVPGTRVLAADLYPDFSSACEVADGSHALPRVDSEAYLESLVELCHQQQISLVIPTIDPELPVLAAHRAQLEANGVYASLPDENLVVAATDKHQTPALFASLGIPTPREMPKDSIDFPAFIKPHVGSSSEGIVLAESAQDLPSDIHATGRYIIQAYVDPQHYDEFTCDLYYDRSGFLKCLVPRLRIETRAGEVSKGATVRDTLYQNLLTNFDHWPGARGCLTVQLFASKDRESLLGIEVNPRFGGGYPLSYHAGARFPAWLMTEYILGGEVPFFDEWEPDLLMLRYDEGVFRSGVGRVSGSRDRFRS